MANIENIIKQVGSQPILMSEIIEVSGQNLKCVGDLVYILVDKMKVQPFDNDLFLIKGFFDSLLLKIRNYFNVNMEMKVGDFKDLIGLNRKIVILVLEYLDKNRYTNRKR
jgi:Elongation factor SelB, winged helix.